MLCMVAHVLNENLQHVRTIRMWRGEFGSTPPFDIGPDALFVAYSAWAEMTCFKVLGWQFPIHVFDLHTAYLAASNILLPHNPDEVRKRQRKGLSDACRAYGIEGWEHIDKPAIAEAIGEGRWREYGKEAVLRLLRRGREELGEAAACATAPSLRPTRPHTAARRRRAACSALVKLQREGGRADPGARHADRHAAVEFGAGEQASRHRRIAAAVRPELRQRRSDLHTRWRVELRAVRALARRFRRPLLAAPRERQARHRRRRLSHDEPHSGCGGHARAARQHRLHRQGAIADRA